MLCHDPFSPRAFSSETRLCFRQTRNSRESASATPDSEFKQTLQSGRDAVNKYANSQDPRTRERIQQYLQIERGLVSRFAKEPAARAAIAREGKEAVEELYDVLTALYHNRKLSRRNRFDTDEEYRRVQSETAAYLQRVQQQKLERKQERDQQEGRLKAAEEQWNQDLEIDARLINSESGSNGTIRGAIAGLMPHLSAFKSVWADHMDEFLRSIDIQIAENGDLSAETKERLRELKKALQ